MIKRTLYFGNPAYLHTTNEQLIADLKGARRNKAGTHRRYRPRHPRPPAGNHHAIADGKATGQ